MPLDLIYEAIILNRSTKFLTEPFFPHMYFPSINLFTDICLEKYIQNKTTVEKLIQLFHSPLKILKEKGEKDIR